MLVITTLVLLALLAVVALVVDVGFAKQYRRQAQNSADAAALAAAQDLDGTAASTATAIATAKAWALKNNPSITATSWVGCQDAAALALTPDTANSNTCISFAADRLSVRVQVPVRDQPVFFGRFAGGAAISVGASARAGKTPGNSTTATAGPCGLCQIGPGNTLKLGGGPTITITNGAVQAHNLAPDGIQSVSPLPIGWYNQLQNGGNCSRCTYTKLASPVPNPFAAVTVDYAGLVVDDSNVNLPGSTPLLPGRIYRQSVTINSGTVNLAPGTYYFRNGFNVNGGTLTGTGVTLVLACEAKCNGSSAIGNFNFNGGTVNLSAPTTGPYAGLSIVADPTSGDPGVPSRFNANVTLNGGVYLKNTGFETGTSGKGLTSWTVVSGGQVNLNQGYVTIDNQAYYAAVGGASSGSGSGGTIALLD